MNAICFQKEKTLAAIQREAQVVQQVEALALEGLTPAQRAMVDELHLHPALADRSEIVNLMASAPSPYWAGFGHAVFLMRLSAAEATGREFV